MIRVSFVAPPGHAFSTDLKDSTAETLSRPFFPKTLDTQSLLLPPFFFFFFLPSGWHEPLE
jgi:hypothetical protein